MNCLAVGDGNIDVFWELSLRPAGVAVRNARRIQSLDTPTTLQYIAGGVFILKADAANNIFTYNPNVMVDMKAQRKLKENDQVVLTHIGNDADYQLVGNASLHFKE